MNVCTPEELQKLTGKRRPSAQMRVLARLGIYYRARPDGTLVVMHQSAEAVPARPKLEPQLRSARGPTPHHA